MNLFPTRVLLVLMLAASLFSCRKSNEEPQKSFSFAPDSGVEGSELIITVAGFNPVSSINKVIFNGIEAQITSTDQTQIRVVAPQGVTTGPVTLVTGADTLRFPGVFTVLGTTQEIGTLKTGDVLVAGPGRRGGTVYKNGMRVENLCYPGAIFEWVIADKNDVYTAGEVNGMATYWKNGVPFSPVEGMSVSGRIHAIKMVNGKLHMVGIRHQPHRMNGVYWHDGIEDTLPSDNMPCADAWDIAVNGNEVHIVGATSTINPAIGTFVGRYWKNGKLVPLHNTGNNSFLYSIALMGNDVHITGHRTLSGSSRTAACHWKNGIPSILSNTLNTATAFSIAVDGQDVYVAGFETRSDGSRTAMYWKNNLAIPLTNKAQALSVDVFGGNAYVTGYTDDSNSNAFLWKNGESMNFGQPEMKSMLGYSVYVVK